MGWKDGTPVDDKPAWMQGTPVETKKPSGLPAHAEAAMDIGMGAIKGASDIGSTILSPIDWLRDKIGGTQGTNAARRKSLKDFFAENANPDSLAFKGGELAADIAGTAAIGGVLAKPVGMVAPKLASAIATGGFNLGSAAATTLAGKTLDLGTRVAGGAIAGGASAGLVNPDEAGAGAVIGGAVPIAAKAAGAAGSAIRGKVEPEVIALYQKAKSLGIDIPVDRIMNSKPMNAMAASLNYLPLSGRAATEEKMVSQLNRAVSRTFGQDSDNVTAALRKANADLGAKFENTLSTNTVKVDTQFLDDLVSNLQLAKKELKPGDAKIIESQIDEILAKANASGEIEGQAAYNIKKDLDRIAKRMSNEAHYAGELKDALMDALNRSLGPKEAAAFKTVRQQYGNMRELEKIAQNGAEGGVSVGRLANLKNINNQELQDIADIAAQFVKTRENPHGAMQRVTLGGIAGTAAGATHTLPLLAGALAAGRGANMALNSNAVKSVVINPNAGSGFNALLENPAIRNALYISPAIP